MYRGTTPTITLTLPMDTGSITALNLCFAQQGEVILEKFLEDCSLQKNTIRVSLTEADTLLLDANKGMVEMQLRIGCDDARLASNVMRISVERILKDGCLV